MNINLIDGPAFHEQYHDYIDNGFDVASLDRQGRVREGFTNDKAKARDYEDQGGKRLGFRRHIEQGGSLLLTVHDSPNAWVNLSELTQLVGWPAPMCLGFVDKAGTRYLPFAMSRGLSSLDPGTSIELVAGVKLEVVSAIPAPRQWRCGALGLTRFTPTPKSCDFPEFPLGWANFICMRAVEEGGKSNPLLLEFDEPDPRADCDPELWAGDPEERWANGANNRELFRTLNAQAPVF